MSTLFISLYYILPLGQLSAYTLHWQSLVLSMSDMLYSFKHLFIIYNKYSSVVCLYKIHKECMRNIPHLWRETKLSNLTRRWVQLQPCSYTVNYSTNMSKSSAALSFSRFKWCKISLTSTQYFFWLIRFHYPAMGSLALWANLKMQFAVLEEKKYTITLFCTLHLQEVYKILHCESFCT